MTRWIRFAFIVFVVALDDVLNESMMSFRSFRDFLRYRVTWIVQDKMRLLRRGGKR
jgi:hypothetical protein